ncbi:nucleotide-binding protein [Candidatus Contubernalis alkaliaceticus]|uniref:nucleotide-binding protein n=1 Tax=Candidatus Contubernalis alkaliaceticus TaxID=338645 RepID=UPI001F4BE8C2|nr:AAA family ATPase [Candidatus Contubernalis alkalaceticus]UNC93453.1 AAA family ATPase [Candidatus Contubernalis alkalaceticus]
MDRINVIIVEDDQEERANITEILSSVEDIKIMGEADSSEEILEALNTFTPDVLLIGAYIPGGGYQLAEKVSSAYPGITMIIIERELREETFRKALFAGAKDVIISPYTSSALVDSIYTSVQMELKRPAVKSSSGSTAGRQFQKQGQVITVFSTKGGVGKTLVAVNLAVSLAKEKKGTVALVDLDLDFGNVALALDTLPRYTISDAINEIPEFDPESLESYLFPHSSGIMVLPVNAQPQGSDLIAYQQVDMILKMLKSLFDFVVIDLPSRFSEPINSAFELADLLVMVTTPEVSTVRNIKTSLMALSELNYPKNKIKLVLNKAEPRGEIKPKDVETTLNQRLYAVLPVDYKVAGSSLNKGIPAVLLYPRAKISRSFQDLARKIIAGDPGKKAKGKSSRGGGEE